MNKKIMMVFLIGVLIGVGAAVLLFRPKAPSVKDKPAAVGEQRTNAPSSNEPEVSVAFDKEIGLFSAFEGQDPVRWSGVRTEIVDGGQESLCPVAPVKDGQSSGAARSNHCLKAVYPKGEFPGLSAKNLPSDWSAFNTLVMDVYNPGDDVVSFGILVKDKPGGHGYANRYDGQFALRPGYNKFVFNVTGLKTNDGRRPMDLTQMMELAIFLVGPKQATPLYFDHIRLERAAGSEIVGMQRFDFGPEKSEVWPGFMEVTDKTRFRDDLGYGWHDIVGLDAQDCRYPDALFRDWVRGKGTFKVNVGVGRYVVYMMLEDPGFWEYYQNYQERKIFAQGELVGHETMSPETFFRDYYFAHRDHEDLPGADVFADYVQRRFVWRRFEVNAPNGQLSVRFESSDAYANTLSALIVAPLDKDEAVQGYLENLDQERREFFEGMYVERIPKFDPLSDEMRAAFEDQGFVVFHQWIDETMFPGFVPRPEQVTDTVTLTGYPGGSEPFVLGVYPLGDVGAVVVETTDLVGDDGSLIPANQIRSRVVQYKLKLGGANVYTVRGEMLRDGSRADVAMSVTRFFWMDVNIPPQTPPGTYRGVARIVQEHSGQAQAVNVVLTVLPFVPDEADIPIGLFYAPPPQFDWYAQTKDQKWNAIERQLKDMRDHGMNTMAMGFAPSVKQIYDHGQVELDVKFLTDFLYAYRHFGFTQSISGYGMIGVFHAIRKQTEGNATLFEKALVDAFEQINSHARLLTGRDMVMGLADEVSNTGLEGIDSVIAAAKILKEAGVNATGYFNNPQDEKIFPYVKTATINNGMKISPDLLARAKKTNTDIWFYNIGQNRLTFGFYLWRTEAKGQVQWHYQLPAVDPYFDLDGRESDYCASYPSLEGPINTVWFELAKAGIDDYRYLITLERMIGDPETPAAAKQSAQALLNALGNETNVVLTENQWAPSEYAARRQDVIRMILKARKR